LRIAEYTALKLRRFELQLTQRVFQNAVFDFKRIGGCSQTVSRSFPNGWCADAEKICRWNIKKSFGKSITNTYILEG